ncbi:MAG: HAMP domain-containing protein [Magnetococcales bacterium]|nr:HAMP domain-containing protein [Magnetococcales bacterium]
MSPFVTWPIKWKLILITLATSVVGLLFAGVAFVMLDQHGEKNDLVKNTKVLAQVIANRSAATLIFDDPQLAKQNLAALAAQPSIYTACIYNQQKELFANYHKSDQPSINCPTDVSILGFKFSKKSLSLTYPIVLDDTQLGEVLIMTDLSSLDVHLNNFLIAAIIIIPLSALAVFPISLLLQQFISEPISNLVQTAGLVANNKDYSIRAIKKAPDELGLLADAFNSMLLTIETQDRALRDDITRRQKSEIELNRLRDLLANIVDSMPSILVGVDEEKRVTQWNRKAEIVTGKAAALVLGNHLTQAFPQMVNELQNIDFAIKKKLTQVDMKVAGLLGDDKQFCDVAIFPLISDGVKGAVIRIDDVTERVHIEDIMIQSEKMLSVGGLAAGMAHEINNPLAVILQSGQVIQNRVSLDLQKNITVAKECGTTIEAINSYMESRAILAKINLIIESGIRSAKIVENMLSFSRKSESRVIPQDLADLLDKTLELAANEYDLKKKFDFREIKINKEYKANMPLVPCEGSKIQQVFLNILKNGAQAMAETHKSGEPSCFTLSIFEDKGWARVEIADNGPGMDEATRKRIFEPFFTTKAVGVGTGLGLSVSYFIISEHHHGKMTVESTSGQGTRFIIKLPIDEKKSI